MMSTKSLCWLCVNICTDCRNLYDENGHKNETYEITVKYFDNGIFNHEGQGHHLIVMCSDCWRHIKDFHNFRESVLLAQTKLLNVDKEDTVKAEPADNSNCDIDVPKEEEFIALSRTDLDGRTTTANTFTDRPNHDRVIANKTYLHVLDGNPPVFSSGKELFTNGNKLPSQVGTNDASKYTSTVSANTITNENVCVPQTGGISVFTFSNQPNSLNPTQLKDLNVSTSSELNTIDIELCSDIEYVGKTESHNSKHQSKVSTSPNHHSSMFKRRYHLVGDTLKSTKSAPDSDTFIAKWLPALKCQKCQEPCSSYSLLRMHHLQQHPKETFYIVCCTIKFYGRCAVEEHIRSSHTKNPTCCKCGLCGKYFKTNYYLQRHIFDMHKNSSAVSSVKCGICNASRTTFAAYQNHFRIKHPDEEFYVICGQSKISRQIKEHHENRHTP